VAPWAKPGRGLEFSGNAAAADHPASAPVGGPGESHGHDERRPRPGPEQVMFRPPMMLALTPKKQYL